MAVFAYDEGMPGGALVVMPEFEPRDNGTLVYLTVANLEAALARVSTAGGQVTMPPMALGKDAQGREIGSIALILDSEGNRVGLFTGA